MEVTKVYVKPLETGKKIYFSAVTGLKKSKTKFEDYVVGGGCAGVIAGGSVGLFRGIILPPYLGWQLGEYVGSKLELGSFFGTCLDVTSAFITTPLLLPFSLTAVGLAGILTGGAAGAAAGVVVGGAKKGLEAIVGKEQDKID